MATYILELLYAPLSPQKALDKLSRLGSPSPSRNHTRSPAPSAASASSSRLSHPPRQNRASTENPSPALNELGRSGSETERESTTQYTSTHSHSSHSSSSHSRTYSLASPRRPAVSISSSIAHLRLHQLAHRIITVLTAGIVTYQLLARLIKFALQQARRRRPFPIPTLIPILARAHQIVDVIERPWQACPNYNSRTSKRRKMTKKII